MSLVTVITPTYRRDPLIVQRCIGCVLLQTHRDWEMLMCSDGGREDVIVSLVARQSDPRIEYHNLTSKKAGDFGNTCRQQMLKKAVGDFILFLDDDNIILPTFMEKMVAALDTSGKDFVVCDALYVYSTNMMIREKMPIVLSGEPVVNGRVDPVQVLVRTSAMLDIGWDTEVGYNSDGVTLERLGAKYEHVKVDEVLCLHL